MSKQVNWSEMDTPVEHEGTAITLPGVPADMPIPDAIRALERKYENEERKFSICEWVENCHPCDAMIAFIKAVRKLHGFASFESSPGFFGAQPPNIVSIQTGLGPEDRIQVPIGMMKLPGVVSAIQCGVYPRNGKGSPLTFAIHGEIKNKEKGIVMALAIETRRLAKEESIYKGRAVSVKVDGEGNLNYNTPPEFMDVSDVSESSVLFDSDTEHQITTNILTPIKKMEEVVKHGIPLGRGILLEGPYGTGKSLTARVVANVCERYGWTFVLLDNVKGLQQALAFAQRYAPSVVFAEDIDRLLKERDEAANDLINTISGVGSHRRDKVMIILTTNFVHLIDPSILRPGRLDAVISLRAPNASTVERLIRHYGKGLLRDDTDLTEASVELAGHIPAAIREVLERSKLSMINRGDELISGEDIIVAAKTMKAHLALLEQKPVVRTAGERIGDGLNELLKEHFEPVNRYVGNC